MKGLGVVRRMVFARVSQKMKESFHGFMVDLKACLCVCALGVSRWNTLKVLYVYKYFCVYVNIHLYAVYI